MNTKVKICGIRTRESAQSAIRASADFLGFNFVSSSTRRIDLQTASKIILKLTGRVQTVGIFQDTSVDQVNNYAQELDLDFVQLHGNESPQFVSQIKKKVIKAIPIRADSSLRRVEKYMRSYTVDYFLLDRADRGRGGLIDKTLAKYLAQKFPIFLAGGLTHESVGEIASFVRPYGVDVAGGIETDGKIDNDKITMFINQVKGGVV